MYGLGVAKMRDSQSIQGDSNESSARAHTRYR